MALSASTFFSRPAAAISPAQEALFFARLKLRNNTFKRTDPGRFETLDAAVIAALKTAPSRSGEVLDVAVSSGMTTLELDAALAAAGFDMQLTATDHGVAAFIVDLGFQCRALVDPEGHVLQYEVRGRALQPWRRRLDYVTGMAIVRNAAQRWLAPRARAALSAGRIVKRVDLVSPRLSQSPNIRMRQDDVTQHNPDFVGRFRLVRAANILNHGYFDPPVLRRALANLVSYLEGPGALLLVVRTDERRDHHATLFMVDAAGDSLLPVARVGRGSEVEALVPLTLRPRVAA